MLLTFFFPKPVPLLEVCYNFFQEVYTKITQLVYIVPKFQVTGDRDMIRQNHTYVHGTSLFSCLLNKPVLIYSLLAEIQ